MRVCLREADGVVPWRMASNVKKIECNKLLCSEVVFIFEAVNTHLPFNLMTQRTFTIRESMSMYKLATDLLYQPVKLKTSFAVILPLYELSEVTWLTKDPFRLCCKSVATFKRQSLRKIGNFSLFIQQTVPMHFCSRLPLVYMGLRYKTWCPIVIINVKSLTIQSKGVNY